MVHSHTVPNSQSILHLAVLQNASAEDTFQALTTAVQCWDLHAAGSCGAGALLKSSTLTSGEGGGFLITELTTSRFCKTRPFQECPLFSASSQLLHSVSLPACL